MEDPLIATYELSIVEFLEMSPSPMIIVDANFEIIVLNTFASNLLNASKEGLLNTNFHQFLPNYVVDTPDSIAAYLGISQGIPKRGIGRDVVLHDFEKNQRYVEVGIKKFVWKASDKEMFIMSLVDITYRFKIEKKLERANARLLRSKVFINLAISYAKIVNWHYDYSKKALWVSDIFFKHNKLKPPSKFNIRWIISIVPISQHQILKTAIRNIINRKRGFDIEILMDVYQSGKMRWNRIVAHPFIDDKHELTYILGLVVDIHDIKSSELKFREISSTLEKSLESGEMGVLKDSVEHKSLEWTESLSRLHDIVLSNKRYTTYSDYLLKHAHADHLAILHKALDDLLIHGRAIKGTYKLLVGNRHYEWFTLSAAYESPSKKFSEKRLIGFIRNVHEDVEGKLLIEQERRKLRLMSDLGKIGFAAYDHTLRLIEINEHFQDLLDTTESTFSFNSFKQKFFVSENKNTYSNSLLRAIRKGVNMLVVEILMKSEKGDKKWVRISSHIEYENNRFKGTKSAILEITEQKSIEVALAEKVRDHTKKLNLTYEQLEKQNHDLLNAYKELQHSQDYIIESEKLSSMGHLVAGVAHEINTPMGTIFASINLLIQTNHDLILQLIDAVGTWGDKRINRLKDILPIIYSEKDYELLTTREERKLERLLKKDLEPYALDNVTEIAKLLVSSHLFTDYDKFVDFLKEAPVFKLVQTLSDRNRAFKNIKLAAEKCRKITFSLRSYVSSSEPDVITQVDIKESIENALNLYSSRLKYNITIIKEIEDIPPIDCYPDYLEQIWTHLIFNAVQSMDNQGTLLLSLKRIESQSKYQFIEVVIQDDGPGIPQAIQSKIFNPFFTTKKRGEGTGLGLVIVKKAVTKHHGTISFTSVPGETKFTVKLPINLKQILDNQLPKHKIKFD